MNKKKILMLLLSLCSIVQLAIPAFAAPSPFLGFEVGDDGVNITINGEANPDSSDEAYKNLMANYKGVAQAITGVCIITSLLFFLYQITRLGAAGSNERLRKSAMTGILISGAVLAVFGGLETVVSVFWHAF